MTNTPGKGLKGQNCNRTACQRPNSAHHFNRVMNAHYCIDCAQMIEAAANSDGESFYTDIIGTEIRAREYPEQEKINA